MSKPALGVVVPALLCLALGGLGGVGTALVTEDDSEAQPVRFTLPRQPPPHFRLRDESGTWRTPASARGDVLLVTFIFTRCRDLCPRQAAEIAAAVGAAGVGVQVYAISVDPEHDTPEAAQAWLRKMGVAGGPVHVLVGSRRELEPVWERFGIVPIARSPRAVDPGASDSLADRPPPTAAHDPYPAIGDGRYRGRPRHGGGVDFEHSAYAILIDRQGRQRVGFPYEQIDAELLAHDIRVLAAGG